MLRLLLDNGEDPQFGRAKPDNSLLGICAPRYWVYAEPLINDGTDVNVRGEGGRTAMYWAAVCDNGEMINLLVDKGADINSKLEPQLDGHTPLHGAVEYIRPDAVRVLIQRGADVRLTDTNGKMALQLAESEVDGCEDIVSMLKKAMECKDSV
jgi:ankyrin repeat protein